MAFIIAYVSGLVIAALILVVGTALQRSRHRGRGVARRAVFEFDPPVRNTKE